MKKVSPMGILVSKFHKKSAALSSTSLIGLLFSAGFFRVRGVLVVPESMLGEGQPQELDGATIVGMMVIGPETARLETGRINAIDVGSEVILKEIATAALGGGLILSPTGLKYCTVNDI